MVPALLDTVGTDAITLVTGDAMTLDLDAVLGADGDGPWRAVSNLPYNVATPIVMRLLEDAPAWRRCSSWCSARWASGSPAGPGPRPTARCR